MDRLALFLFVCIASRLAIAYGIQRCPHRYLPVVAVPAFLVSVGLLVAFFQKKMVGGFGGAAWWHPYRPVHAAVYLCLGVLLALRLREAAFRVALADVMLALLFLAASAPY